MIMCYSYGLLAPLDWGPDCYEHLWLQNRLWNQLVEIEHGYREQYRELVAQHPETAPLEAEMSELKAEQAELRKERKAKRQRERADVKMPEVNARLKVLAQQVKSLGAELRAARKLAREALKEPVAALNSERFEAVKLARQQSRLFWGNYNAICQSYEVARGRAMKDNTELRFHRFRGEGRFTVQVQGGVTPEDLFGGARSEAFIEPLQSVPGRKGKPCPRLRLTVYTTKSEDGEFVRRMVTWPLVYHRPLPPDARIQQIVVTRKQVGTKWRYEAKFTVRVPDAEIERGLDLDPCGINLGFRVRRDGGIRVAMLADQDGESELALSAEWIEAMEYVESLQQRRDHDLNTILALLKEEWIRRPKPDFMDTDLTEQVVDPLRQIITAPRVAAGRLAAVVIRWRDTDWWPMMRIQVEAWRRRDKRLLEEQANRREKLLLHRREQYRLWAREVAQRYGIIAIGEIDLKTIARLEVGEEKTELYERARRNRTRASLYQLQQELHAQAAKAGSDVVKVPAREGYTQHCHVCGTLCEVGEDLVHICVCGARWDQDINAARNILSWEGAAQASSDA